MNELTPDQKRPLDRAAMSNDPSVMKNLLGLLNNPEITGAEVPREENLSAPVSPAVVSPESGNQSPTEQTAGGRDASIIATLPPQSNRFFFFTGRPGSGKKYLASQLGCRVISLDTPLRNLLSEMSNGRFLDTTLDALVPLIRGWANGEFGQLTIPALLFIRQVDALVEAGKIPEEYKRFGTEHFCVDLVTNLLNPEPGQYAVIGVNRESDFRRLMSAGFVHYHVMCHPHTPGKRGVAQNDAFASALDADVINKISRSRTGPRLRCVWNDENPPAPRFYSVADFIKQNKLT